MRNLYLKKKPNGLSNEQRNVRRKSCVEVEVHQEAIRRRTSKRGSQVKRKFGRGRKEVNQGLVLDEGRLIDITVESVKGEFSSGGGWPQTATRGS